MKLLTAITMFLLVINGILPAMAQLSTGGKPLQAKYLISVWHWGSSTEPWGINNVVKDERKALEVIKSYQMNHVNRVYGGYLRMASNPVEKQNLKRWNKYLYDNQIKSIYLLGSPKWIYPEFRNDMLELITYNYILFNKSVNLAEKLHGIHLDIEIHALPEWSTASVDRKREMMQLLKDTYRDVRDILAQNGMNGDELMADIPFWYDSMVAVGWKSEADRKGWFTEVARYLNGFSIMDYGNSTVSVILERAKWERDNFKGIVEIGLNSEEYGTTWKTMADLHNTIVQLITQTKAPVAIHRYVSILKMQEIPPVK